MAEKSKSLDDMFRAHRAEILEEWLKHQTAVSKTADLVGVNEVREESSRFLEAFAAGLATNQSDIAGVGWNEVRNQLGELSRTRARLGFTPTETATFVFSLKKALFDRLVAGSKDPGRLAADLWSVNLLLDKLGLYATEMFMDSREEMIRRQQQDLLELSTPVVKLWDGVLALPIIGTLDSARTQSVMESLLQAIVEEEAEIAIIDITGVPTVDTLVAQHLLKTVSAARLMGADCIISGIRPQIAQTIVHLGVSLDVATKATMADAFSLALRKVGLAVTRKVPVKAAGTDANG